MKIHTPQNPKTCCHKTICLFGLPAMLVLMLAGCNPTSNVDTTAAAEAAAAAVAEVAVTEVEAATKFSPFTKLQHDALLANRAHGKLYLNGIYSIRATVVAVSVSMDESSSAVTMKAKPWNDSAVVADFRFGSNQSAFVGAFVPGDTVNIKAKLKSLDFGHISFEGAMKYTDKE